MIKEHIDAFKIIANQNTFISDDSTVSDKALILQNTVIIGCSIIKDFAIVGPNSIVFNSIIEENAEVVSSYVFNSLVGKNSLVGPYANLRDKAIIGNNCRIGNFVEIKKSRLGSNTKASHLAYLGDATIGSFVNMGCGSITVNYDGHKKHKTEIGDNSFIGCNVNLVAPIKIGSNTVIGCGSTITSDVSDNSLAIARVRQLEKKDYFL